MSSSEGTTEKAPWSFEMFLRKTFKNVIDPVARFSS